MKSAEIILAQCIPFIIFYLFFAHSHKMIIIANTPLGKFMAILLIIFYTAIDYKLGLFVCVLVVLFYQMDMVEGMTLIEKHTKQPSKIANNEWDLFDWIEEPYSIPIEDSLIYENFENNSSVQNEFRKKNCKNGQLVKSGLPIKRELADIIFQDLEFLNDRCNPCDTNCQISIIEQKLQNQENITYPKQSNDWLNSMWNSWFNANYQKPYAAVNIKSQPFTFLE